MATEIDWPATRMRREWAAAERQRLWKEHERTRDPRLIEQVNAIGAMNSIVYRDVPDAEPLPVARVRRPSLLRRAWDGVTSLGR